MLIFIFNIYIRGVHFYLIVGDLNPCLIKSVDMSQNLWGYFFFLFRSRFHLALASQSFSFFHFFYITINIFYFRWWRANRSTYFKDIAFLNLYLKFHIRSLYGSYCARPIFEKSEFWLFWRFLAQAFPLKIETWFFLCMLPRHIESKYEVRFSLSWVGGIILTRSFLTHLARVVMYRVVQDYPFRSR